MACVCQVEEKGIKLGEHTNEIPLPISLNIQPPAKFSAVLSNIP